MISSQFVNVEVETTEFELKFFEFIILIHILCFMKVIGILVINESKLIELVNTISTVSLQNNLLKMCYTD